MNKDNQNTVPRRETNRFYQPNNNYGLLFMTPVIHQPPQQPQYQRLRKVMTGDATKRRKGAGQ